MIPAVQAGEVNEETPWGRFTPISARGGVCGDISEPREDRPLLRPFVPVRGSVPWHVLSPWGLSLTGWAAWPGPFGNEGP